MSKIMVTLYLDVTDETAFRQAAYQQALKDGEPDTDEDARLYLDPDLISLGMCARMVFDPGESPPGCKILDSDAETY